MKSVVDMNLSPLWVDFLQSIGHEAAHWSTLGKADASDVEVLDFALQGGQVLFTHDLDFGAILASTRTRSPSVFQIRTQIPMPETIGPAVKIALSQFDQELSAGALVTVDISKARVHLLPIAQSE